MGYDRGNAGLRGYENDPQLSTSGDLTVKGQIKTGHPFSILFQYHPEFITFGGIENEGRVIGAGALATSAALTFGDGYPRRVLPDGATTDVYATWALEEWWLSSTIGLYIEWTNDHSATGNVRWQFELKECDIATQKLSEAGIVFTRTITVAAPPVNGGTGTLPIARVADSTQWTPSPGPVASYYALRMTRIGGDPADSLLGPVGLCELSYVRGQ